MPATRQFLANQLLAALSPACQDFLAPCILTKPIAAGEVLYEAGTPLQYLIFPCEGLISIQFQAEDRDNIEVHAVGTNGMVGSSILLDRQDFLGRAVAIVSGRAAWLPKPVVDAALERFPCIRPAISTYLDRVIQELMQSVVCASCHPARQRIASWLIHASRVSQVSRLDVTQQTMGSILGLRTATVSETCSALHNKGAISYSRGSIAVADPDLLRSEACGCRL